MGHRMGIPLTNERERGSSATISTAWSRCPTRLNGGESERILTVGVLLPVGRSGDAILASGFILVDVAGYTLTVDDHLRWSDLESDLE